LVRSFAALIGMTLVADGLGFHVPKGFVYAAIGFSMAVEGLNLLAKRRQWARHLQDRTRTANSSI
jgi:predicted tellurium resistance membrane protein TerC